MQLMIAVEAMDLDDFMAAEGPAGRRSALEPYRADLLKLRERGYTLAQMQRYLALNDIKVSVQAISQYLAQTGRSRSAGEVAPTAAAGAAAPRPPAAGHDSEPGTTRAEQAAGPSEAKGGPLPTRAQLEEEAREYISDKPKPLKLDV